MQNPDSTPPETGDSLQSIANEYLANGPHPEWRAFAGQAPKLTWTSSWSFVQDAVDGTGGFSTGRYLVPYKREINGQTSAGTPLILTNSTSTGNDKLIRRQQIATYTNIADDICKIPWTYVFQSKDMIKRKTSDDRLTAFWQQCDASRTTSIVDFLSYPVRQSRMFGTGIVCIDRPSAQLQSEEDDAQPNNAPYIYAIPTKNLVGWEFDEDGDLTFAIIAEPVLGKDFEEANIRIWSESSWALFQLVETKSSRKTTKQYIQIDAGDNELGEVPLVFLFNEPPGPRAMYGPTEMLDIAKIGWDIFNKESELREQERNSAFNQLTIPMREGSSVDVDKMVISSESLLIYDGTSGKPEWIAPHVDLLNYYREAIKEKVAQAYSRSQLKAIQGVIKTTSGFHTEAEFQQTGARIALLASQIESFETRIARLVLRYYGVKEPDMPSLFSVEYPRDFGIRDIDKLITRSNELLAMGLGKEANRGILFDLFSALHPRKSRAEIQTLADESADRLEASLTSPTGQASQDVKTGRNRVRSLLNRYSTPDINQ